MSKIENQLAALAEHLAQRQTAILRAWRKAVDADPELTTHASLPKSQFIDHIPRVLDAYAQKLLVRSKQEVADANREVHKGAGEHGLHRWQQGYKLREVTREWGHLHLCIMDELESFAASTPLESAVMTTAWRALAQMHNEGVTESSAQFFHLQETEAAGQVKDVEQALEEVHELDRQRGELWRQAAHDLRGNLSVVANASMGLGLKNIPEASRETFVRLLQKSVASLMSMLEDVMGLARLQAAQERRVIEPLDAGAMLKDLFENLQPMAAERGLALTADGPASLVIEGDPVKIRRIAQNLLLNALKYTHRGGVTLSWGDSRDNDAKRWMLTVQDTGPGFHAQGSPMVQALKDATVEAQGVEEVAAEGGERPPPTGGTRPSSIGPDLRPVQQEAGEGIGLSIVKRLCDLLDASLELESTPGVGTIFRVILPRQYDNAQPARE